MGRGLRALTVLDSIPVLEKTSARCSHMVNISLIPKPFPSLITLDNKCRTVGKENMSQEKALARSQELPFGVWGRHVQASRRLRGRGSSLRGQLLVRCLSSLLDPQTTGKTNPVTLENCFLGQLSSSTTCLKTLKKSLSH